MADTSEEKNNLGELFSALPENVRKWLASEELVFIISEIETKLGLSDEKILIIPKLILRMIVQDIAPQDFIGELSKELGVDFAVAKTITEDIEKKALRPIEAELRDKLGLEIKLIYYGKTESGRKEITASALRFKPVPASAGIPPAIKPIPAMPVDTRPMVDLQSFKIKSPAGQTMPAAPIAGQAGQAPKLAFTPTIKSAMPPAQPAATAAKEEAPAMPFILHQESPTTSPTLNQRPIESSMPKTNLTMKVQNYFQSAATQERTAPSPISIKVQTQADQQLISQTEQKVSVIKQPASAIPSPAMPSSTLSNPIQPAASAASGQIPSASSGQVRVVNYSSLRTPLNSAGLPKKEPENVIDLRKFQ